MSEYMIAGRPVYTSEYVGFEVRKRTHKKKRINKKWRKYGVRIKCDYKSYMASDGGIVMHPKTLEKYKELKGEGVKDEVQPQWKTIQVNKWEPREHE